MMPVPGRVDLILDPGPFPHRHLHDILDARPVQVGDDFFREERGVESDLDDDSGQ